MTLRSVVVTGYGLVSSLGFGVEVHSDAFANGQSGVRLIEAFDTEGLGTTFAGSVQTPETGGPAYRTEQIAKIAMEEALAMSALDRPAQALIAGLPPVQNGWPERFALQAASTGTGYGEILRHLGQPGFQPAERSDLVGQTAARLADEYGIRAPAISVSTACSSGNTAIILACDAIKSGRIDCAVVLGADASLSPEMLVRFGKLGALSTRNEDYASASRPFDLHRDGFVPGEGAAALVLEAEDFARARGATARARVSGMAELSDAHHRLRHSPDGSRIADVMNSAIVDAGLNPADIDYVSAHGTSTPENDLVECLGCQLVFGKHADEVPVSSLKSMIGHTLSAAAAIEAVASIMMLERQIIYPTINYATPDPDVPLDVVPNKARSAQLTHILSNSFGFGGQNCALVLSSVPSD